MEKRGWSEDEVGELAVQWEETDKGPSRILIWRGCCNSFPETEILRLVSPMVFFFNFAGLLKFSLNVEIMTEIMHTEFQ